MHHHDNKEVEVAFAKRLRGEAALPVYNYRHKSVRDFADWVESTPAVKMNMVNMVIQHSFKADASFEIASHHDFFRELDQIIGCSPQFGNSLARSCPFYSLVWDFRLCSEAVEFLRNPTVNAHFKAVLKEWCVLLSSPASCDCLHTGPTGFLSPDADALMNFSQYEMDLSKPHGGFGSFNEFFSRPIKLALRPIADPADASVVVSPCDCRPDQVSSNVFESSYFWIKKGMYSLRELLADSEHKASFVGGSAIQAYLNPFDYHGWHAPVDGTVLEVLHVDGFYAPIPDVNTGNSDCLWYLSHLNTRVIIVFEADHRPLGKVALINVGMGEVSSCLVYPEIKVGARVRKGDKIGTFQFGGSTFCLLFQPRALESFCVREASDKVGFNRIKMGEAIARAPKPLSG